MKLQRSPLFGKGICPMCRQPTRHNVHQRCGELREQAHQLRRVMQAKRLRRHHA